MHLCVCVCIECISENSLLGCDHSSELEPAIVHFLRCIFVDIIRCLLHFSLFLQICILSHFAVFLLTFAIFLITFGLILLHFFVFPHIFLHLLHFVPILLHIILGPFRRFYHISCIFFTTFPDLRNIASPLFTFPIENLMGFLSCLLRMITANKYICHFFYPHNFSEL